MDLPDSNSPANEENASILHTVSSDDDIAPHHPRQITSVQYQDPVCHQSHTTIRHLVFLPSSYFYPASV